jgi:hypothetical protein
MIPEQPETQSTTLVDPKARFMLSGLPLKQSATPGEFRGSPTRPD